MRINHTYVSDLDLFLIGPDGTTVLLSTDNGDDGGNYGSGPTNCSGTFTTFDDQAGTSIVDAAPPFAGTFRPEASLGAFNGKSAVGQWRLRVADAVPDDVGTLYCWELGITREPAAPPQPPRANVGITLTNWPDRIRSGGTLSYTILIGNSGPDVATATTATFNLPSGATYVAATSRDGTCAPNASTVTCSFGGVPTGLTETATVVVQAPAVAVGTSTISATASVQSSLIDPVPGNNTSSVQTTLYSCVPRPVVIQTAAADGSGRIKVTVRATSSLGAPANRLREIQFGSATNARIEIYGEQRYTPFTERLLGLPEIDFVVRREAPGAFTAPFVVVDDCGEWPSFAGGGVNVP